MNNYEINYNADYVNNLIKHLNPPALKEIQSSPLPAKIIEAEEKIVQQLSRSMSKTQIFYSEEKARQLVIDYINNPECTKALQDQHQKVVEIYRRLTHLPKGAGTWADGIDQELLYAQEPILSSPVQQDLRIPELEEMIHGHVIIPDPPEEQIFKTETKEHLPPLSTVDPSAKSYTFESRKALAAPTPKMLFHIHADEFGKSSALEGSQAKYAVDYLKSYLQASQSESPEKTPSQIDALIQELTDIVDIPTSSDSDNLANLTQQFVEHTQGKIQTAFETGSPLMMVGGWVGVPYGHAMYYEIIPDSKQSASFRIYNTGAGIAAYHPSILEGQKVKYQSYVEWKGIDREKLQSPYFLEALFELNSYTRDRVTATHTKYGQMEIYQGLKQLLSPQSEWEQSTEIDKSHYRTAQRAGICSWKSLMAFMRTKMDLHDYKRFKCDIKLQSLHDFVLNHSPYVTVEDWRLVQKSHQNLCRAIVKLYQNHLVGDDYIQAAQKILTPISEWIEMHSDSRFKRTEITEEFNYSLPVSTPIENRVEPLGFLHEQATSQKTINASIQPWQNRIEDFQQTALHSADIETCLQKISSAAEQAWQAGDDLALHRGLVNAITNLRVEPDFWKDAVNAQAEKAEKLIVLLGRMAEIFLKSCYTVQEPHIFFSHKIYVIEKILYLQQILYKLRGPHTEKKIVFHVFGNLAPITSNMDLLFLSFPQAKIHEDIQNLKKYVGIGGIPAHRATPELDKMALNISFDDRFIKLYEESSFLRIIRKEYPQVLEQMAKENPHFIDLPDYSQDAHLFASSHLPDWIKAVRTAELARMFINQSYFGAISPMDRHSDIQPQLRLENLKDSVDVIATLKGVTSEILQNPDVKKIRDKGLNQRYASQYPEIQSNPLKQMLPWLQSANIYPEKEKEWLTTHAQNFRLEISDEDYRELFPLLLSSKVQHTVTLEYFTKYPSRLKDRDYQTLLQIILFKPSLKENLMIEGFSRHLSQFIEKHYQLFRDQNEVQASVFLLKLAFQLQAFCPEDPFYAQAHENLKSLLEDKGLEPEEKTFIYAEILAQLGQRTSLDEDDVAYLLSSAIYVEQHQPYSRFPIDPNTRKEGREALILQAQKIKEHLERGSPNQNLLNKIFQMLYADTPIKNLTWELNSAPQEFPSFSTMDGKYTIYPLLSRLTSPQKPIPIPSKLQQNPLFSELFPDIKQGLLLNGNIISFNDSLGRETLVYMKENNDLVIEQKIKLHGQEKWCRFVSSACLLQSSDRGAMQSLVGSRPIVHNFHHWQSMEMKAQDELNIYALDKKTGNPKYLLSGKAIDSKSFTIQEIQDLSDASKLGKTSSAFTFMEDPAFIHEWYTENGALKKIEFPRLQLSFHPDPKNPKKLLSDQHPDYFINNTHTIKELGIFRNYLVLENEKGMRRAILTQHPFKQPSQNETLQPRFEINLELHNSDFMKTVTFDLQKNGKLFHKSSEANLYLAQVLAISQEYHLAADYLRKQGEKPSTYTPQEQQLLKAIANITQNTGDLSGNSIAIQLYATYLRIKNTLSHHHEISDEDRDSMRSLCDLYLDHFHHTTALKLSPHEELFVLKTLLEEKFEARHFMRLKELDPESAATISLPAPVKDETDKTSPPHDLDKLIIPECCKEDIRSPPNQQLLTRFHEYLQKYFLYFYELARIGKTEERERLKNALAFVHTAEDGKYNDLAYFFEALLEKPGDFPEPLERNAIPYSERTPRNVQWRNQVTQTAARLLANREPMIVASKIDSRDSTSPGFHVDVKPPPFKPISFKPDLPPILGLGYETALFDTFQPVSSRKYNFEAHYAMSSLLLTSEKQTLLNELMTLASAIHSPHCAFLPEKYALILNTLSSLPLDDNSKKTIKEIKRKTVIKDNQYLIPSNALNKILKIISSSLTLEENERLRLKNDLDFFLFKGEKEPNYNIQNNDLDNIIYILSKERKRDQDQIQTLEKEILALANKPPSSPAAMAYTQIGKWGELHKVITIEEILVHFAQNNYSGLLQRNPALQESDLQTLADKAGAFLLYATRHQQRERADATINKIEDFQSQGKNQDDNEYKELVNELALELDSRRMFDPQKRPAYLVFEYYASIIMRPSQVDKLEKFLKEKDLNLVMEMIMGSGKSKVLLPLLGLMRADGKALSMLIVPQQLFESVAHDTKSSLQGAFSQTLRALHFDRHTPFTKEFLENILKDLEHIKKHKECLIMTNKSVQCLVLKFISESAQHFAAPQPSKEFSPELKLLGKILSVMHDAGYPLIDEADTVLNVLHEINFSGGHRLSPPFQEIELISEIYSLVYENPELKKIARMDSDPDARKTSPLLTESLYFDKIQRPLAEAFIQRLYQIKFESETLNHKLSAFVKTLNEQNRQLLMHYLCRDKAYIQEAQQYFDALDENIQDIIALAGEQISHLLPYTLTRNCDEKYGLDIPSGNPLAIPFSATNTPNTGSQFANPLITMNFTIQTYMKKGISRELIEGQLKLLQEQAMREISASGGKLQVKDTKAGIAFALLKGYVDMPLFNYKSVHLYELEARMNANPAAKRAFVTQILLPQLELHENKISCNPHNLAALFSHISGFTGTLWNSLSMHHALRPEPQEGTDAKTLHLLWNNSRQNTISLKEGSTVEMLNQLNLPSISFDMICDAGGYFKDGGNRDIAHEIASIQGKETVYYNSTGEQTITDKNGDIPLAQSNKSEGDRLTFLDQIHTTGADIPQKWNAIALVTIGHNMLLRDILQSVWRLRGLNKSQQVRFVVSEEVASIIRQKLSLKDNDPIGFDAILKFAISNQAAQQGIDNYKALKSEFANIPQILMLNLMLNNKLSYKAKAQAFHYLQSYWIHPAVFSAKDLYGKLSKEEDSSKILEKEKTQCLTMIKHLFSKMPWLEQVGISQQNYTDAIEALAHRFKGHLPETLKTHPIDIADDQTVEVEQAVVSQKHTHKQTEAQRETKTSSTSENIKLTWISIPIFKNKKLEPYKSFKEALKAVKKSTQVREDTYAYRVELDNYPTFPLKSFIQSKPSDPCLKPYLTAFEGIHLSLNVLEWSIKTPQWFLLGSNRTDFHHVLVNDDDTVTLITHEEAQEFCTSPQYYNLTLGFNDPNKKPTTNQLLKIVKLKFLNGESQYSKEEINLLKLWFKAQGTAKMQALFVGHILSAYPQKTTRYQNSPLQKLFAA